jgi:hypothetical protein
MRIFKEKAWVFSEHEIWVCIDRAWMYTGESFAKLIFDMIWNWRNDSRFLM